MWIFHPSDVQPGDFEPHNFEPSFERRDNFVPGEFVS